MHSKSYSIDPKTFLNLFRVLLSSSTITYSSCDLLDTFSFFLPSIALMNACLHDLRLRIQLESPYWFHRLHLVLPVGIIIDSFDKLSRVESTQIILLLYFINISTCFFVCKPIVNRFCLTSSSGNVKVFQEMSFWNKLRQCFMSVSISHNLCKFMINIVEINIQLQVLEWPWLHFKSLRLCKTRFSQSVPIITHRILIYPQWNKNQSPLF